MTLRKYGSRGLAIVGLLSIVLVLAACGGDPTTTVPPVTTTEASTTTTEAETTTSQAMTSTTRAVTTTTQASTTTTEATTTTTQAETTTTAAHAAPAIASLSPTKGPVAGGATVVITGTDFVGLSGAGAVKFGDSNATSYTVNSATKITAKAPAHAAGAVRVKVTTPYGASADTAADDFTYVAPPAITALSPTSGATAGGATVVITGTNFIGLSGAAAVTFGGTNATKYAVDSATKITVKIPAHAAGAVQVKVTSPYGASADTAADDFTYVAAPAITGLSPASGPIAGGATVVITGTGFVGLSGAAAVKFGDTNATGYTVNSATTITATAPAHATGPVRVKVTTPYGASGNTAADDFTYVGSPTITGIKPTAGTTAGGTSVVISGTDLTGVTAVTFEGTAATFTLDSNTKITAAAPAHAAGKARVEIAGSTVGGPVDPNAKPVYYQYVDAPVVTGIAPAQGSVAGGNKVVITGSSFVDVTKVLFGDAAAKFTVDSATKITAVAPPALPSTVRVHVAAVGGASPEGASDTYTYSFVPGPPVPALSGWWYKVLGLLDGFFAP